VIDLKRTIKQGENVVVNRSVYLLDKCVGVDPDWNDLILTIYLLDKCVGVDPD
jgi:hypothetical protein